MNVPKLRFKEFNDEWISKKLFQLVEFSKGNILAKADLAETGNYPCILYGQLYTKYNEVIRKINSKTNRNENNIPKSKKGDVLIPSSGETPIDISTSSCIQIDNVLLGGDINILRPISCDGRFLSYLINNNKKTEIAKVAQGHSVVHLYNDNLKQVSINIPSIQEQKRISDTLELLDKKIELQSRKIEDLKLFKICTLDRYFNKNINETRSLLKNYCFCLTGKSKIDKVDMKGKYYIMDMGTVNADGNILKIKPTFCNSDLLSYGDLVMPKDDVGGGLIIGKTGFIDEDNKYILGDHVYLLKTKNINSLFLHYQINSRYINRQLKRKVTGSAQLGLKSDNILNQEIFVYSDNTQEKIANIFKLMDKKIELECNELNKLLEYKKGLMQNMFV